jgi:hypothetical protein
VLRGGRLSRCGWCRPCVRSWVVSTALKRVPCSSATGWVGAVVVSPGRHRRRQTRCTGMHPTTWPNSVTLQRVDTADTTCNPPPCGARGFIGRSPGRGHLSKSPHLDPQLRAAHADAELTPHARWRFTCHDGGGTRRAGASRRSRPDSCGRATVFRAQGRVRSIHDFKTAPVVGDWSGVACGVGVDAEPAPGGRADLLDGVWGPESARQADCRPLTTVTAAAVPARAHHRWPW